MVVVNIIGGLGNQMFQYAAGKALALAIHQPLQLDISEFSGYELHQGFELDRVFRCQADMASEVDIRQVLGWRSPQGVRRVLSRPALQMLCGDHFVVEPHFHYWPGMRSISGSVYLQGYWQSEKYFSDVADVIRADFSFKMPLSEANMQLVAQINNVEAVSLHVRRGDYVANPKTNATHGLCTLEYYRDAVRYISERIKTPEFFVFSDDIEWVKANLKIKHSCHYIDHNHDKESYNDMHLMSLCRHHIIANSSFSWWGAWLNPSPEKIVVAPLEWFANNNVVDDLFPAGWVTL
jgi:Glycosyl transferase family 11